MECAVRPNQSLLKPLAMSAQNQERLQAGDDTDRLVAAPQRDDALLQVLIEIRNGLKRLEDNLNSKPAAIESKPIINQSTGRSNDNKSSEIAAESSSSAHEVV